MEKCKSCKNPANSGGKYCDHHEQYHYLRTKKRYEDNKNSGRCRSCPELAVPGKILCVDCQAKKIESYRNSRESGICVVCGKSRGKIRTKCDSCHDRYMSNVHAKKKQRMEKGLCSVCDQPRMSSSFCKEHFLKNLARIHLLERGAWRELESLWERQKGKCVYTGRTLVLGSDASIDHKIPKSKGGSNEIKNLQWVYFPVNLMKQNFLEEEFLALVCNVNDFWKENHS